MFVEIARIIFIQNGFINQWGLARAFREWRYFNFEKDKFMGKNWFECPSCAVSQHSCHVDGNSKLYRYKSAGK